MRSKRSLMISASLALGALAVALSLLVSGPRG